ncbi:hypothetical protein Salat_2155600 [Sesamum alatum]|uniref:RNase H type-1 domain-containing protein n=1 Tax=Sesamum alatum TaxID=300844 RepID=A0AAE1Y1L2_9LAMI|nr:hypothetical protein Salat_2155600 [Sesamum alatum]
MDYQSGVWNSDLIDLLFCSEDAVVIKSIPLGRSIEYDTHIWHFDKRDRPGPSPTSRGKQFQHGSPQPWTGSINLQLIPRTKIIGSPPKVDEVKINFDASVRNSPGAGLGAITRDNEGRCLAWRTIFHPDIRDPEHGEALAACLAMEICADFGWTKCVVEGDCALIIQKLATSR